MNEKQPGESSKEYRARWMREWRAANPGRRNEASYKWRSQNPQKAKESQQQYLRTRPCPEHCEACGQLEPRVHRSGKRFELALDHCHRTGRFRGWLCSICNTTAGRYKDDHERIQRLATYLRNNCAVSGH